MRAMKRWRFGGAFPTALGAALTSDGLGKSVIEAGGPPSKGVATGSAYLCQFLPRVDRRIVTGRAPANQFVSTFTAQVTVSRADAADAVAAFAGALRDVPRDNQQCPAEFAVSNHLVCAVRGEKGMGGKGIDVHPTDCQFVSGLAAVRTTMFGSGFYRFPGRAMRLKNASYRTFTGTFRSGGGAVRVRR